MSNGEVSLQMLAEILRGGSRDRQVIERTNPFLEHVGKALQEQVGNLTWDTSLQHRRAVKEPQYLNRAYVLLSRSGLELMVVLQPGEIWWGLHKWGAKETMKRLQEALQGSGLLEPGEEVLVGIGDFGGWRGGAYLTMGHSLTAEDVLQFPDERGLIEYIADDLAHWFQRFSSYRPPRLHDGKPGAKGETGRPIDGLQAYLSAHRYHFPPDLLATYYLSLQTKPFVILSGLSGTGKTKLAQYFAEWMGTEERATLIPVHPDWTDHRGLLGFCHLLTGTYHATDFLRLLLAAQVDWMHGEKRPYFVTLDEMNLARVEHYFADFLSVLESRRLGEDGAIHQDPFSLHDQPRCLLAAGNEMPAQSFYTADADYKACIVACETCPFQHLVKEEHGRGKYAYDEARKGGFNPLYFVPPRLEVPLNVYFTGTVNVDETTFTFSPKVLDRANVIEFGKVDLEGYWGETGQTGNLSYTCADDSIVRALTHEFTYPFTTGLRQEALQELNLAPYREQLAALVHLLEPFHMHFGYRVADEILVYLLNARCLDDPAFNLHAAFDCAVLQKILPRFHGARARLWQPLLRLLAFCTGDPAATEEQAKTWGEMSVERIREQAGPEPQLPRSTAKLLRMLSDLETEGFTSFT